MSEFNFKEVLESIKAIDKAVNNARALVDGFVELNENCSSRDTRRDMNSLVFDIEHNLDRTCNKVEELIELHDIHNWEK